MKILPISTLYLFPRHTRATWREAFGSEPPPYNPDLRIKRWSDPAGQPGNLMVYNILDEVEGRVIPGGLRLNGDQARSVNLPGVVVYPTRVVAPTEAVVVNTAAGPGTSPLNPRFIASLAEAEDLAREVARHLGLSTPPAIAESDLNSPYFRYVWGNETRRVYSLYLEGKGPRPHNVGLLLERRHEQGLNAPGRWQLDDDGGLIWVSQVASQSTGEHDMVPEIPMPVRILEPNEAIQRTVAGWVLVQDAVQTDRQILEDIQTRVADIQRRIS